MRIPLIHRKERIVLTAIDIIDELGINGLSTKEIALRQGISEGTLFKHFKSKNEIIMAVLNYYSKFDKDIFESVTLKNMKPTEALTFVIDSYATYFENYPAITVFTQMYDMFKSDPELSGRILEIYTARTGQVRKLIEEAQQCGEIDPEIDGLIIADIVNGAFRAICLNWRVSGRQFPLRERTLATLRVILSSFSNKNI